MVVEKDIVAISIPFSAGVVTAALVPPGSDVPYWLAAGSLSAAAGLLCALAGRGGRTWPRHWDRIGRATLPAPSLTKGAPMATA